RIDPRGLPAVVARLRGGRQTGHQDRGGDQDGDAQRRGNSRETACLTCHREPAEKLSRDARRVNPSDPV
ncbi:MAG TPA: hypothetical protein VGQ67_11965, partial [Candidatus Polarisedimenticolia bacterium]|nr:hypothetical protein [Candidatus Polarisedimenticolia bacterium]